MFNKNITLCILVIGILAFTTACASNSSESDIFSSRIDGWDCINSFDDFLYQMTEIGRNDPRYKLSDIYPPPPWEMVTELPESYLDIELSRGFGAKIEIARSYLSQTELWIRNGDQTIFRYIPSTEDIFLISPYPYDNDGTIHKDVIVKDIFEVKDGSIFGVNYPKDHETVWREAIPLISIYNELDGAFEFYDIGLRYHADDIKFGWVGMIPRDGIIIANDENAIWIYQQQDGLYNYNLQNSLLHHHEVPFTQIVQRMVISPDGNLLFSQEKEGSNWTLHPGELIQYSPIFQTITEVNVPFRRWPDYGTLLYVESGDLWLGIHGFLSSDGDWVLRNPKRRIFTDLGRGSDTYNWAHPKLLFQSSNGYLWYTAYSGDFLGVQGSAWYDPAREIGCWFTTEAGIIVEDTQQTLWMVTDGKLYKLTLSE
ncbi:hypothetical protein [Candidatus Leptofilum sp.]|uniref:hypothetical protein n=1 Tax=Candidatus Leptofilum sp. TaxID=3241576 RepID=UPI003B5C6ADE